MAATEEKKKSSTSITLLTEQELEQLEEQNDGRIVHLRGKPTPLEERKAAREKRAALPAWEVVFRAPSRQEYKQCRKQLHDENMKAEATERLARTIVIHPSREEFDALLERFPGIGDAAGKKFAEVAGASTEEKT